MRTIEQIKTHTEVLQVSQLRENALNGREVYEGIDELGAELKDLQVQSLLVFPSTVEGDFTILDGHRRRRGAIAGGKLTLRCEVMEEVPSVEEQLRYIHSAGTTAKNLRQSELANVVQDYFDILGDDELVAQRLVRPVEYVKARRLLASSTPEIRKQVDSGQVDAMELLKLDDVAEEFAGTEFAEKLETYIGNGPSRWGDFDVNGAIARARFERDLPAKLEAVKAELKEHKAKVAPDAMRHSGGPSTMYSNYEAEKAWTIAEHVEAGHQYYLNQSSADVTWYWKSPKKEAADPNAGLSPEEIAQREVEQAALDEAQALQQIGNDRRELWLKERFEQKDPMPPLQARVALMRVLIKMNYGESSRAVLSNLTGIPEATDSWMEAVESNLSKRSWSWLASAIELTAVHAYGLTEARKFHVPSAGSFAGKALTHLQERLGYAPFPEEVAVAEYHAAEAKKYCVDCEDRATTDHNGRCTACAEEALVQHCEGCSQAMVEDSAGTLCVECAEDED